MENYFESVVRHVAQVESTAAQALHDDAYAAYRKVNSNPAGHIAIELTKGAVNEVKNHPGKIITDVAVGAAVATGVEMAAVPTAVVAGVGLGIGAVAAVGYGVYKSVEIARKEGIAAIPKHVEQAVKKGAEFVDTEIHLEHHTIAERKAADKEVEAIGGMASHVIAGGLGGVSGRLIKSGIDAGIAFGDRVGAQVVTGLTHRWQEAPVGPALNNAEHTVVHGASTAVHRATVGIGGAVYARYFENPGRAPEVTGIAGHKSKSEAVDSIRRKLSNTGETPKARGVVSIGGVESKEIVSVQERIAKADRMVAHLYNEEEIQRHLPKLRTAEIIARINADGRLKPIDDRFIPQSLKDRRHQLQEELAAVVPRRAGAIEQRAKIKNAIEQINYPERHLFN